MRAVPLILLFLPCAALPARSEPPTGSDLARVDDQLKHLQAARGNLSLLDYAYKRAILEDSRENHQEVIFWLSLCTDDDDFSRTHPESLFILSRALIANGKIDLAISTLETFLAAENAPIDLKARATAFVTAFKSMESPVETRIFFDPETVIKDGKSSPPKGPRSVQHRGNPNVQAPASRGHQEFPGQIAAPAPTRPEASTRAPHRPKPLDSLPSIVDQSGRNRTLSDLGDRILLLHFWSSTCGPCRRELPLFSRYVHSSHLIESGSLRYALITTDNAVEEGIEFLREIGIPAMDVFHDRESALLAFLAGSQVIPKTIVYDLRSRRVVGTFPVQDWNIESTNNILERILAGIAR